MCKVGFIGIYAQFNYLIHLILVRILSKVQYNGVQESVNSSPTQCTRLICMYKPEKLY